MMALALMAAAAGSVCDDAVTQQDLNACAQAEFERADAALNVQWEVTADAMKARDAATEPDDGRPGYFTVLLDAQRSWIAYRDRHCVSEGYYARGGSMEPMLVSFCRAELTDARTAQLADLIAR